jgi:phosphoenolpyruvate-protein kinase (PTS system EI component)
MMLIDGAFQAQLDKDIEDTGHSAEHAVSAVLNRCKAQLAGADSDYLQQRVADICEIEADLLSYLNRDRRCRRCADAVGCSVRRCRLGNDHILVARELTASLPLETDQHTLGFIVEQGGPNSHAVILARALRRPVVGNIHNPFSSVPMGAAVLIDGNRGEVILNPSEPTRARYRAAPADRARQLRLSTPVAGLEVLANIGRSSDIGDALAAGAEGVGLYRTEMEVLVAGKLLGEAEQTARYSEVVRAMRGRPVCIRLLDLGQDKSAAWIDADPQSGSLRGARLLLARPELLRTQARALARACVHGPVQVLYPMITGVEQFLELRSLFEQAVADLQPVRVRHGVLFEVPSACLRARQLIEAADFGCIGTNDLIQYLFATSRGGGDSASHAALETDALLWELIQTLSRSAEQAGKPMTICGELAGNPDLVRRIMQSGVRMISTSPSRIAGVRRALQEIRQADRRVCPADN